MITLLGFSFIVLATLYRVEWTADTGIMNDYTLLRGSFKVRSPENHECLRVGKDST